MMVVPGTGRGALSQILKPSTCSIVRPPIDCAHCVGGLNVVVRAKADAKVLVGDPVDVSAAGAISKDYG